MGLGLDIRHHFIEEGCGHPLILLHGNGEDSSYFINQIEYFSKDHHVYAIDTRGHGKTPRGDKPFTIRQFADDLRYFMLDHEIPSADILGFSDGGNIAMVFAIRYPEMVDHLILNGANLNATGVKLSVQLPIDVGFWFARLFSKVSKNAKAKAELLGLMVNDPNVELSELKLITAPTLVIAGDRDMIRDEHTRLIAENIRNAKLCILEGNHFVASMNPKAFNMAVKNFLLS